MDKKIVIINTSLTPTNFLDFFEELSAGGSKFCFFLKNKGEARKISDLKWRVSAIPAFFMSPKGMKKANQAATIILSLLAAIPLAFYIKKKKIDDIICFSFPEKIYFSLIAPISRHKTIWIEKPEIEYGEFGYFKKRLFSVFSRKAAVVALNSLTIEKIKKLKPELAVRLIHPGVRASHFQRQENIFEKIAEIEYEKKNKNFFTVGTVSDLKNSKEIEMIFKAVKMALEVVPSIQIIIIGDGPERKNSAWLAKKMDIENLVWFVGEQKQLKKWLDNFDVYVHPGSKLDFESYRNSVMAQICGLPTISREGIGLDDVIIDNKSGFLLDNFCSEKLADKMIELLKDDALRKRMSENAKNYTSINFNIEDSVKRFREIL